MSSHLNAKQNNNVQLSDMNINSINHKHPHKKHNKPNKSNNNNNNVNHADYGLEVDHNHENHHNDDNIDANDDNNISSHIGLNIDEISAHDEMFHDKIANQDKLERRTLFGFTVSCK